MAYESGGSADKLGNRFEKRWIVQQLLHVLAERIRSVKYEPVGPDEKGVDLWITFPDGLREAQQCKSELGTRSEWSIADLASRGILKHLRYQLERDRIHGFALVSSKPAVIFSDLANRARSAENASSYWEHQIKSGSRSHREGFLRFCNSLALNKEISADLEIAFDLLRRSHFHLFSDDNQTLRSLGTWSNCYVGGSPDGVLDALGAFVESEGNFRRELYIDEIYDYLHKKGYPRRNLAHDKRLSPLIEGLRDRFSESIRPNLAAGQLIPRAETREILKWVSSPGEGRLLLLHGPAGGGKSGVLYELTTELASQGIPYMPLRLDLQLPE